MKQIQNRVHSVMPKAVFLPLVGHHLRASVRTRFFFSATRRLQESNLLPKLRRLVSYPVDQAGMNCIRV